MQSSLSVKRIFKDLKKLNETKLVGIAACIPDEQNITKVHANILIQEGLYKGLLIPIILELPIDYPLSPPAAYVIEQHPFNHKFHEHVLKKYGNYEGCSICTDLTSNFASYFQEKKGSGWSPAYTIQSVLIQLQTFLARPDLPKKLLPSIGQIKQTLENAKNFVHTIKQTDNGQTTDKIS
jgi:ubiquitin-protein ligase